MLQIFDRNPSELCTEIVVDDDNTQNRFHYRVQDTPGALPTPRPTSDRLRWSCQGCACGAAVKQSSTSLWASPERTV